jgi:hypothetical protein
LLECAIEYVCGVKSAIESDRVDDKEECKMLCARTNQTKHAATRIMNERVRVRSSFWEVQSALLRPRPWCVAMEAIASNRKI